MPLSSSSRASSWIPLDDYEFEAAAAVAGGGKCLRAFDVRSGGGKEIGGLPGEMAFDRDRRWGCRR